MTSKYDVIIIGGGPSGSSAALFAHKAGLKTILLDKSFFPRDKICGDALSGKSVRYMKELDILEDVKKLKGSTINRILFGSPNHKIIDINLTNVKESSKINSGFVIPRKNFDNLLFSHAKENTEVKEGFKVTNILYDKNRIIGVSGIKNNCLVKLYAPLLLICDGANSTIARKLNLFKEDTENTAIALRCYYKNVKGLTDQIELHFVDQVLPGYFWIFPAGENLANIGIGLSKKEANRDKRKLKEILSDVIKSEYFKDRFSESYAIEKPKGWSLPLGRIVRPTYGDGYMLLGDAAGFVDPFTGEGIGNAMASAKYAIEIANKAKNNNDYSNIILSEYHKKVWSYLGPELKTSTRLQDLANYKILLNLVINKAAKNATIQDIISGMLKNETPKERLSNPMFYLKVLFS